MTHGGRAAVLAVRGVSKTFGTARALRDVDLDFPAGTVTALLGENGSGKSTLIKILTGVYAPDEGSRVTFEGAPVPLPADPRALRARGLGYVHQDLGLVDDMSVADNLGLAAGFPTTAGWISGRRQAASARETLARLGVDVDPATPAGQLPASQRTLVALARALAPGGGGPLRAVILDEPTAALPESDVRALYERLAGLRDEGVAVVVVTHRLEEVLAHADRVAVLRDGAVVAERDLACLDGDALVALMLGHDPASERPARPGEPPSSASSPVPVPAPAPGPAAPPRSSGGPRVGGGAVVRLSGVAGNRIVGLELDVRAGEILGVTGIVGCGRSELTRLLSGAQPVTAGQVTVDGRPVRFRRPADALAVGIVAVPQDRRGQAVLAGMTLRENLTIGDLRPLRRGPYLGPRRERAEVARLIAEFGIRPADPERPIELFSGGNQQKAVIARCIRLSPRVLVLDEPTQGIDIGARGEISAILRRLAGAGMAIVLATSDHDELVACADRAIVLDRGRVARELAGSQITRAALAPAGAPAAAGLAPTEKETLA